MHNPSEVRTSHVVSRDGTQIGCFSSGNGPPLLLIHGSLGDHSRWDVLRPYLEPHFTVHAMDRRGRGASGDAPDYSIEREYEDVAAVIDDIARSSETLVDVYCSSYGGLCLFGALPLTSSIRRLALYEAWPAVDPELLSEPESTIQQLENLLAQGKRDEALEFAYREGLQLNDEQVATLRSQPSWPARVAAAHTIPREARAFRETRFDPEQANKIVVPTLLVIGSESPVWGPQAEIVSKAIPESRIAVLDGQGHTADLFAPELVSEKLFGFLLEPDRVAS
jgi:pimeloyl-ACP methyl ester carboxylesterase